MTARNLSSGKAGEISAPAKQALKRETKRLIEAAGGLEAAALYARPNKTAMGDYGSPNNADRFMPIDAVADLEAITRGSAGWPIVTRMLAKLAGCALVELPTAAPGGGDWMRRIGKLAQDHGALAKRICDAAEDGEVTAAEIRANDLIGLCDDAILTIVNLRALFERTIEDGPA